MTSYQKLIDNNPFKIARGKMTQQELADQLNVSVQYIYRHENGLVNSPSASLCEALEVDAEQFYAWVGDMRRAVARVNLSPFDAMLGPYAVVTNIRDEHPFTTFMFNFNYIVGEYLIIEGEKRSQQLFNRLLCLHPRAVQQYLAGSHGFFSPLLARALSEVGIPAEMQDILQTEADRWIARVRG